MKKTLATIAIALAATTAQADTAKVFHYDLNKKVTIDRTAIDSQDLVCISRLSVFRDFMFNSSQAKSTAMNIATTAQDKLFMKYPFTIPTKWIGEEKAKFLIASAGQSPEYITAQVQECL